MPHMGSPWFGWGACHVSGRPQGVCWQAAIPFHFQTDCGYSTSLLATTYFWVRVARRGSGDLATDLGFQYSPFGCSDLQSNGNCPTTSSPTSQQATWGICQARSPTCEEPCFVSVSPSLGCGCTYQFGFPMFCLRSYGFVFPPIFWVRRFLSQ